METFVLFCRFNVQEVRAGGGRASQTAKCRSFYLLFRYPVVITSIKRGPGTTFW